MTHRSHFDREFSSPHQLQSRIPQDAPNISNAVDLRLSSPSEGRFAGHDPHQASPSRQGVGALDPDHVPLLTEDQKSPDNSPTMSGLKGPRKEVSNVVIACRQWCVPHLRHSFHSRGSLWYPSLAVVERSDATLRAQYVTTAPAVPTSANTIRFPNAVDPINARALVNVPVRNVRLMEPQLLSPNVGAQLTTKTRSHPVSPLRHRLQESEAISTAVPLRPDIQAREAVSAPKVILATVPSRLVYRHRVCLRFW